MTEGLKEWMEDFETECESHQATGDIVALIEIKEMVQRLEKAEEIIGECVYHLGNACAHHSMPDETSFVWKKAHNFVSVNTESRNPETTKGEL